MRSAEQRQKRGTMEEKKRYYLLDFLRGICILLVVGYHALYNLSEIFGGEYAFFRHRGMDLFRDCFVGVLIVLAGISCSLTRSNLRRGIKTLLWGLVITAVTAIAMPDQRILFGILHFFGCAMLLWALLGRYLEKIPLWIGVSVSLVLFFATQGLYAASVGWSNSFLCYILGFCTGHYSADYYPLMPWLFLFLAGGFLGRLFREGRVPALFTRDPVPALSRIGRHTLSIYIVHQPVIYGLMYLFFEIL